MEPYAEASCVLKVNVHCPACKMKMLEVLGSISGVYNVTIDSQEGLAKVYGVVNPNMLIRALTRTGYHAELQWVNLRHPELNRRSYSHDHGYYNNGYSYGVLDNPYRHRRSLMDHSYPLSSRLSSDYPYYHGSILPPARGGPFISKRLRRFLMILRLLINARNLKTLLAQPFTYCTESVLLQLYVKMETNLVEMASLFLWIHVF